jgi:InsA C-terminal domain
MIEAQFYCCQNPDCPHQSFLLNLAYKVRLSDIKEQIIDRARGGSSIRDTARVLGMSTRAVLSKLKKRVVIEPCDLCSRAFGHRQTIFLSREAIVDQRG